MTTLKEAYKLAINGNRKFPISTFGPVTLYSRLEIHRPNQANRFGATVENSFSVQVMDSGQEEVMMHYAFANYEAAVSCFHDLCRAHEEWRCSLET